MVKYLPNCLFQILFITSKILDLQNFSEVMTHLKIWKRIYFNLQFKIQAYFTSDDFYFLKIKYFKLGYATIKNCTILSSKLSELKSLNLEVFEFDQFQIENVEKKYFRCFKLYNLNIKKFKIEFKDEWN